MVTNASGGKHLIVNMNRLVLPNITQIYQNTASPVKSFGLLVKPAESFVEPFLDISTVFQNTKICYFKDYFIEAVCCRLLTRPWNFVRAIQSCSSVNSACIVQSLVSKW
jgi:hypothetical protein